MFDTNVIQRHEPSEFFIHTPSSVDFRKSYGVTKVIVDDKWEVPIDRRHQVAGQLALGVDPELLKPEYLNGRYFVVDDKVIDYRPASGLTHVHDQHAIEKLASTIGFVSNRGHIQAANVTHQLDYEAFQSDGGQFNVQIGFNWSPFSIDIASKLEILRLACENMMVAKSPIMNHRIPMLNAWEENLAISNAVIGHSFHKMVGPRLAALPTERISMYDVVLMRGFLNDLASSKEADGAQLHALEEILELIEPLFTPQINNIQRNLLKFIEVPITGFDALNIATEAATHYVAKDRTGTKASAFANNLVFDRIRQQNIRTDMNNLVVDTQTFGCVDRAYFGLTIH